MDKPVISGAGSTSAAEGRDSITSEKSNTPIIYQVAPQMLPEESIHVSPSQVVSFQLTKEDVNRYVYSRYSHATQSKGYISLNNMS